MEKRSNGYRVFPWLYGQIHRCLSRLGIVSTIPILTLFLPIAGKRAYFLILRWLSPALHGFLCFYFLSGWRRSGYGGCAWISFPLVTVSIYCIHLLLNITWYFGSSSVYEPHMPYNVVKEQLYLDVASLVAEREMGTLSRHLMLEYCRVCQVLGPGCSQVFYVVMELN